MGGGGLGGWDTLRDDGVSGVRRIGGGGGGGGVF